MTDRVLPRGPVTDRCLTNWADASPLPSSKHPTTNPILVFVTIFTSLIESHGSIPCIHWNAASAFKSLSEMFGFVKLVSCSFHKSLLGPLTGMKALMPVDQAIVNAAVLPPYL